MIKNYYVKTLVLLMTLIIATSISVQAEPIKFSDLSNTHWAYESVQWGIEKGLVVGYTDGTYKPKLQITEAEFVAVLSRYTQIKLENPIQGNHWSQHMYDALGTYGIPLKGYDNKELKNSTLSRGQIARIVAAKNGFKLDERQAIYYMYENDISYGLISGTLNFDSYGKDEAVKREQIPAFFQRLALAGKTTFMGKPSPINDPTQISGITGITKDTTVITDEMFNKIEKEKLGTTTPAPTTGNFSEFKPIADKHGYKFDNSSSSGFSLKEPGRLVADYTKTANDTVLLQIQNYNKEKDILFEIMRQSGKFTESEIKEITQIIEVESRGKATAFYKYANGTKQVEPVGRLDGTTWNGLTLRFGW